MKVLKFGGTSVGRPERMKQVVELITSDQEPKIIVLSAVAGTTNSLVAIGEKWRQSDNNERQIEDLYQHYCRFNKDLLAGGFQTTGQQVIDRHFDKIKMLTALPFDQSGNKELLAQGELMSTQLFHLYLQELKINAALLPALSFMLLDAEGEPDLEFLREKLEGQLDETYPLFITQGFICKNHLGGIDNLKRGGSDYTASLIAAAIGAKEVQIWTDIDGMHNNDPRVVDDTYPLERLSFDEAAELAYFGAKILHPSSILPAQKFDIPVRLLNTLQPQAKGTLITSSREPGTIKAIAAKDGIVAIKIKSSRMLLAYGFLTKVFQIFEQYRVPIDMITTSEVAVSLTIDESDVIPAMIKELQQFGQVEVDPDLTIVCVVGDMVMEREGILGKISLCLEEVPVRMVSYGGSRNNISFVVKRSDKSTALKALNNGLFRRAKAS